MAKNHEKYVYYDVAVPRTNVPLLSYIEEMHTNTNIPEGQLLVQLATEYVKQLAGGQSSSIAALGPLQAVMASMFSALPQQQGIVASTNGATTVSPVRPPGAVQPLGYDLMQSGAAADDMDSAFGDPD
jgi:hypothetical protein